MNEITTTGDRQISVRANTLLDKETFQQIAEIATMMASASLIPESLSHEGSGDKKKPLSPDTVRANCFLVANQAIKWGMDPFSVAQCCSVVHGRLMFEGKLVSAVLEANLGVKLVHAYGKWDKNKECCILGEDGTGDDLAIRIGEGRYNDDGIAVFSGRFVDGYVGGWKTTGNNTPWRAGRNRVMLIYRGAREFSRIYEPGIMLGVIADDEYDPAFNARDITPPIGSSSGQSVIDRLKQNQTGGTGGFDHGRVQSDIQSALGDADEAGAAAPAEAEEEVPASSSHASSGDGGNTEPSADTPSDKDAGGSVTNTGVDPAQWLFNVGSMLWAATTFNGDPEILRNQRKAAAESFPVGGVPKQTLDKAKAVFDRCMTVVTGECPPEDGVAIIAGIMGVDEKAVLERSGKACA